MKKFVIRGNSQMYGAVTLNPPTSCDDDFQITSVEEYEGKAGEETYVTTHYLSEEKKQK